MSKISIREQQRYYSWSDNRKLESEQGITYRRETELTKAEKKLLRVKLVRLYE